MISRDKKIITKRRKCLLNSNRRRSDSSSKPLPDASGELRAVLAQIDANKKHFQRHVLKERAESALRSMQKRNCCLKKPKWKKKREKKTHSKRPRRSKTVELGRNSSPTLSAAFRQARKFYRASASVRSRESTFSSNGGSKKENHLLSLRSYAKSVLRDVCFERKPGAALWRAKALN